MAKKKSAEGPNKAKVIRDYMNDNPATGPKDVAEAINAEHGLGISAQYVSTIKALMKKSPKKGAGRVARAGRPAVAGAPDFLDALLQAKKLVESLGGVAQAKAALDALAKLRD